MEYMMNKGDFLNPHIENSHDAERKNFSTVKFTLLRFTKLDH